METMTAIVEFIIKAIYAIVGGAISIAFVCGAVGALGYLAYYFIRYGYKATVEEFFTR